MARHDLIAHHFPEGVDLPAAGPSSDPRNQRVHEPVVAAVLLQGRTFRTPPLMAWLGFRTYSVTALV